MIDDPPNILGDRENILDRRVLECATGEIYTVTGAPVCVIGKIFSVLIMSHRDKTQTLNDFLPFLR